MYGDLTYSVTDRLRVNLGLRVNNENNTYGQSSEFYPILSRSDASFKVNSTRLLPKVALLYEVAPDVNTYVQWTRGYKSGGGNLGSPGVVNPGYRPEILDAYEVGLKSQFFGRRLTANVAAFYYDYTDLQVFSFTPPASSLVQNADARLYGVEGDFRANVTDHLTLSLAPTWLHGTFKNFVGVDPFSGAVVNLNDKPLPRAPNFSVNAGVEQRIDLGGTLLSQLSLTADLRYNSTTVLRYFNLSPYDRQKGYFLFDLSASVVDLDRKTRLSVFVDNVTDQIVRESSFSQAPAYIGNYGPPRTWGVRLSRRF